MARTRNIKPAFFTNEVLAECPALARLLFAGLWTLADRDGRLEDRPKKIKAEILPYDECDINALLDALHEKKFIFRYEVDNNQYIQILKFTKHQTPHQKENASLIPAPDLSKTSTGNSGTSRALTLNPSSLTLNPQPAVSDSVDAFTEMQFETFFHAYPGYNKGKISDGQKGTKEKARQEFRKSVRFETPETITAQALAYGAFLKKTNGIAKTAFNWLSEKGWETNYGLRDGKERTPMPSPAGG